MFDFITIQYNLGLMTDDLMIEAVQINFITADEYKKITGKDYVNENEGA